MSSLVNPTLSNNFSVAETTREFEAKYLLPKEHRGENEFYNCGTDEKELFNQELAKAERKGGRVPKVENSLWEGVINLNKKHTIEDVNRVGEHIAKKFNIHYTRGALHRDEGHIDEKGKVQYNIHAHINFMTYKDGKQNWRLEFIDKEALRELQTEVAELLGMERGELNSKSVRANHRIFREKADEIKAEREALKENSMLKAQIQDLKKQNSTLKGQNTKLKNENSKLKEENKKLEEQIKKLNNELKETLKDLGALRPQYAQLEQLNKDLKEDLKNKVLDHEKVVKSYQDLEKNLKEELTKKDEKINDLEVENKDLKSELEALKYQLDLKEKRSQSYFGLNKELKEEIVSLKEQINALEAQNEVLSSKDTNLEEKINSRPNMDDLSSPKQIKKEDYLKDIVNQYDSTGTGKDKSEALTTKKTNLELNLERIKEKQKKESLLDKFKEVDNKQQELETPEVKKRSFRER
jgi:DNA repair exonuclease SbcCD ATPase subunit